MPEFGYIALMIFRSARGRPDSGERPRGDFPGRQADVDLALGEERRVLGAALRVLRCSTPRASRHFVQNGGIRRAVHWKPPPGVAVPSTTTVLCCGSFVQPPPAQ